MIIKEIQLISFGKFNHKVISLQPGLNIIYGENEAGKTTLHTFIRGMLFGIEKQRGKASARDTYTKYEPWENSSNYQGMMRIENNGVNYRIERNFSKEHKVFKIVNEDLGIELSQQEIEELFEGLDESCYYNTVSISQLGSVTDKELESVLKNYAANLGSTKSMEIDMKRAFADLDEQRKKIMAENKIGEEELLLKSMDSAKDELEITEREQHTIIASIEQKKEIEQHLLVRKKELSSLDAKRLEELAKNNERKENLYQEMIRLTSDVEKYSASLLQIQEHGTKLKEQLSQKGIEDNDTMELLTDKVLNKSNMPIVFILLMMACLGTSIGFIVGNFPLIAFRQYWMKPAICMGGAVVFLILSIIKYLFNRNKKSKKLQAIKELRLTMDKLDAARHEEVYVRRQLDSKEEALANAKEMMKAEEEKELQLEDYSEELRQLDSEERENSEAISKAQWILDQKKEKEIETEKKIEEITARLHKIQNAKEEIAAIDAAKAHIEEIAADIRNNFGKKLNERASYYMGKITGGKYDNVSIDANLNISINSKRALIASHKLSKGTVEQVYMALRLAAADIIFEKDKKPILLDDTFAMYDNKRMGNTIKFMAENMEQVIIFSCHTREKLMADKLGLKYKLIKL